MKVPLNNAFSASEFCLFWMEQMHMEKQNKTKHLFIVDSQPVSYVTGSATLVEKHVVLWHYAQQQQ